METGHIHSRDSIPSLTNTRTVLSLAHIQPKHFRTMKTPNPSGNPPGKQPTDVGPTDVTFSILLSVLSKMKSKLLVLVQVNTEYMETHFKYTSNDTFINSKLNFNPKKVQHTASKCTLGEMHYSTLTYTLGNAFFLRDSRNSFVLLRQRRFLRQPERTACFSCCSSMMMTVKVLKQQ